VKNYEFNISTFNGECPKTPDLSKEQIYLLQRKDHYDYLLSSNNLNITKIKKFASTHIKHIEGMVLLLSMIIYLNCWRRQIKSHQ